MRQAAGSKQDPSPTGRREAERALDGEQGWSAAINSVIDAHRV